MTNVLRLVERTWACSRCKEHKPESAFHKAQRAGRSRPVQYHCVECEVARNSTVKRQQSKQQWREDNREKLNACSRDYYHNKKKHDEVFMAARAEYSRWRRRLKKYGVTKEQYETLLMAQDGKCAICSDEQWLELRVDHNHDTGAVRGLLCANCNTGIGMLKDNPKVLASAIAYLA